MRKQELYDFGVLTIAKGAKRYIKLAKNLGYSLKMSNPNIMRAIATDSDDPELIELFDIIIKADRTSPSGFSQKLYMYDYSPFKHTLFIDADSLVIKPLDNFIKKMKVSKVSAQGFKKSDGEWAGVVINEAIQMLPAEYLIIHNGGVYYFEKSPEADLVFAEAKKILSRYDEIGFYFLRGKIAHEPLMSSAMSMNKMNTYDDQHGVGMRTFVDISSDLKINVLDGICEFGEAGYPSEFRVKPCILHFSGAHADSFHYRRETMKMKLKRKTGLPNPFINSLINFIYNPAYATYIVSYRSAKVLLGKAKFKIKPLLPTLKYK